MSFSVSFAMVAKIVRRGPRGPRLGLNRLALCGVRLLAYRFSTHMTKLVIIDDHEALREGLVALLGLEGVDVVGVAGNIAAGADLVEHGEPDAALIAVRLPDGSGIDLARELLDRWPELGVILYTGDSDLELLRDGLDSGARGYALKAGSTDELVGAIVLVGAGGSYVDPRLNGALLPPRPEVRASTMSPREKEVVQLMAEGLTAEAVGDRLGVSVETVRTHVRNVVRKLGARNRVHAIVMALERGEISLDEAAGAG
jgi:DNA-binding NarL/FixJ family response regulator